MTEVDWPAEAVRLRREEQMATAEIAERVGRSASQVRKVIAQANTERAINGRPSSNGNGPHEIPGQTTVDDHLPPSSREGLVGELDECDKCGQLEPLTYAPEYGANFCATCAADPQAIPPEDDPEHPDTLADFRGEAGEAVGPMPPTTPPEPYETETRLAGTRQMALDFGPNADVPIGGTLVLKSDKLASGFYGLGDIITGTFEARVVDVGGKERLQRASEEFRAQPQAHVALITDLTVTG